MLHRFYLPESFDEPRVTLRGAEAHHAADVLRLRPGDRVTLFDGRGNEALAEIETVDRRTIELGVIQVQRLESSPSGVAFTLATAVPKGERFRWLVEKATELGVDRLVPLVTERSVVTPSAGKLNKLRQTIIAACKQSGRNRLMILDEPMAWPRFVARESSGGLLLVAHPGGERLVGERRAAAGRPILAAIGPEGGFSDEELTTAVQAGARLVGLGPHLLRIETAAIALSAMFPPV